MAKKTEEKKTGVIVRRNLTTGELRFYARVKFQGEEFILTPPLNTMASAHHKYLDTKADIRRGSFVPPLAGSENGTLIQDCIESYMRDLGEKKTARGENYFAYVWGEIFKGKEVTAITPETLVEARTRIKNGEWPRHTHLPWRKRSGARCNRYMQWLHQMCNHPINQKRLNGVNPVKLKMYGEHQPPITTISEEEEDRIAEHLAQYDDMAVKRFRLALLTGMRASEQFMRLKSEVDLGKGWIMIPSPKKPNAPVKRPRYIILSEEALDIVRELMQTPGKWLNPHLIDPSRPFDYNVFYKYRYAPSVKKAGLSDDITWHTLRHTWATRFIERYPGEDGMRALMEAGGWSDFKMVLRYTHFSQDRIRAAQEAVAKKSGTKAERAPRGRSRQDA